MTCEQCNEWLGDVVDGTIDLDRHAQIDAHCRGCADCRELLADLNDVRAAAAALDRLTPSPDVWRAIAAQIGPAAPKPRIGVGAPQLSAAAALVIMLGSVVWISSGTYWRGRPGSAASDLVRNAATELQLAEQHYANAITALEQLTVNRDTTLDPTVAAEIAQSLESIDRAIDDSRAALKSDPDSFVAQTSLLEALRMKVGLLQETVSLMNAAS